MLQNTICVDRQNFEKLTPVQRELGPVKDGHIRVRLTSFALTANNVTYMATGDLIGYWNFFDPQAYGIEGENIGRMPVWGFADITTSRVDGLDVGSRIYGLFPSTDYFDMQPA